MKITKLLSVTLSLFVLTHVPLYSAEESNFTVVPKIKSNLPLIDGNFTLAEWNQAAALTGFVDLAKKQVTDSQTTILLAYDDQYLYFAAYALFDRGQTLVTNARNRDGQVWSDDSVEFLFATPFKKATTKEEDAYTHLIVNSLGTFLDERDREISWNSNWIVKAGSTENWNQVGLKCWYVEGKISFKDLDLKTPQDGEQWKANFGRNILGQNVGLLTSWANAPRGSYSTMADWGILEFRETTGVLQCQGIEQSQFGEKTFTGSWKGKPSALKIDKADGSGVFSEVKLTQPNEFPELWSAKVNLQESLEGVMRLQVFDADGKKPVYRQLIPYKMSKSAIRLATSQIPSQNRLLVKVDPVKYRKKWKEGWSVKSTVQNAQGKNIFEISNSEFKRPYVHFDFDTEKWGLGKYTIQFSLINSEGEVLHQESLPFEKKGKPVWFGNTIGISEKVPKPWTPLEVAAKNLKSWGREYQYGESLFPQQILSQNHPLLAAPMQIMGAKGEPVSFKIVSKTPAMVTYQLENSSFVADCRMEFDGMLWFELKSKSKKIDSLSVEIPLKLEESTLYQISNSTWAVEGFKPGYTPDQWASSWKLSAWVGNEKRGINWFAESDQYWSLEEPNEALQIIKGEKSRLLRINFVTKPHEYLDLPVFRFGIQATPTRPPVENWRGIVWQDSGGGRDPGKTELKFSHTIIWWLYWSKLYSNPFSHDERMVPLVEKHHKAGVKVIPYHAFRVVNTQAPDALDYQDEWVLRPAPATGEEGDVPCYQADFKSSYTEYLLYGLRELVKKGKWDGIYFDFGEGPPADSNEVHGSGYVDEEGVRKTTHNIHAYRAFLKRLRVMLQEETGNEDPMMMAHLSANKISPIHTFFNYHLDGEQFQAVPKVIDDYTKVLTLDTFRAEFLCEAHGAVPVIISQTGIPFSKWTNTPDGPEREVIKKDLIKFQETLLLYVAVHGTVLMGCWTEPTHLMPYYQSLLEFETGKAEFIGYWDNSPMIKLEGTNADVKASLYRKKDKVMVVLGNFGMTDQAGTLQLDLTQLAPELKTASQKIRVRFGEGEVKGDAQGRFQLAIPSKRVRIFEVSNP